MSIAPLRRSPGTAGLPPVSARERVLERRDVRQAVEFEFGLIPPFLVVELVLFGPGSVVMLAACLGALAALGLLGLLWWRGRLAHDPFPVAYAIGIVVIASGAASATTSGTVAYLMVGMYAVVAVGCAAWMPWPPRWHVAFLVMAVVGLLLGVLGTGSAGTFAVPAIVVGLTATITSLAGHWLVRQHRRRAWVETLRLRTQQAALRRTVRDLQDAQRTIRRLEGTLPMCAACHRVRDGEHWERLEAYLASHSEAEVSHGICPECAARLYPTLAEEVDAPSVA